MKNAFTFFLFSIFIISFAQVKPITSPFRVLPQNIFRTLRDSCTQIDIVFTTGKGGSMSLEGRNVVLFSTFVESKPISAKKGTEKNGFIMWQRNGREYITGDVYLTSDTSGYLFFKKGDKEYFNQLSAQGSAFLKKQEK